VRFLLLLLLLLARRLQLARMGLSLLPGGSSVQAGSGALAAAAPRAGRQEQEPVSWRFRSGQGPRQQRRRPQGSAAGALA